jgi:autotransporter-associated beta strand protein
MMMRFLLSIMLLAISSVPVYAVVIADPGSDGMNGKSAPENPGWAYVDHASTSSCVYLGNGWALTCRHVAQYVSDYIYVNGQRCLVDSKVNLHEPTNSNLIDLTLIHVSTPVSLPSFSISSVAPTASTTVMGIGLGVDQQTSITYWDADWNEVTSANYAYSGYKVDASGNVKRWGTNTISSESIYANPLNVGWGNCYELLTVFNSNAGGSEFQAAVHDSGGGLFFQDSYGNWQLAGIIEANSAALITQPDNTILFRKSSNNTTGNTLSIDLSKYRSQITATVQVFQIASQLTNPAPYIGSGWQSVQLIGDAGFTVSSGNWNVIPIDTNGHAFTVKTGGGSYGIGVIISGDGGITKSEAGTLTLTNTNTYSGVTSIAAGNLQAAVGMGLPNASLLQFDGGIFQSVAATNFTRSLGTGGGSVAWTLGGGFSAGTQSGSNMTVEIGGGTSTLGWSSSSDDYGSKILGSLKLSSSTAVGWTLLRNNIDLNGAIRTVQVDDNTASTADFAIISGVLSNSSTTSAGLEKTGDGLLYLTNVNTYDGPTVIDSGILALSQVGQISESSSIVNNATFWIADGLTSHTVGSISGSGMTYVAEDATLYAASIVQDTLVIGGSPSLGASASFAAAAVVPEPATWILLAIGLFAAGANRGIRQGK